MRLTALTALAVLLLSFSTIRKTTWVAIGDSITYLNEHPNETGNRVKKGYMTRVAEKLPFFTYFNQGHNGWTSGGIAEKFDELNMETGDVYSIFLGTNDWWQGRPIGTLEDYRNNRDNKTINSSFGIIIDKIRRLNPQAKIILITPMQRMDFVSLFNYTNNAWGSYKEKDGQTLESVAAAIKAIGDYEHIPVIDLYHEPSFSIEHAVKFKRLKNPQTGKYKKYRYPASNDIPFNPATDEYPYPKKAVRMTYDALHPSDKGNEVIANKLAALLGSLF
ncbi:MAG: SGNH/GDSL hydrolase family protein [Flavihumibacter sp.]